MDFYIDASKILTKLDNKSGSIKGLTLQSGEKNGPRTYALIVETLKYRQSLTQVITKSELLVKERKLAAQGNLALVLVHDLLLNKSGIVANSGPFKDAVMRHKTRLNAEWTKTKIKLKVKDNAALARVDSTFIPRWARINTLKITKRQMLAALTSSGFEFVNSLDQIKTQCVYIDEHISNLLAFHPQQSLTTNKHYLDGSLIFQNKASCIPAAVCDPPNGSHVIDACAAPGNKTSHLAALLHASESDPVSSKLFAFERDNKRVVVLGQMLEKAGANVEVTHGDFTRTDPMDSRYAKVTHLLLDPSCSGSGIVNRLDYLTESNNAEDDTAATNVDEDRLDALAGFQLALLLHAMKFPAAKKITYSTCSIHAIENEHVVMEALRKSPGWRIAPRSSTLPKWPSRGILAECDGNSDVAEGLIRAEPGALGTIGFFVASFVKGEYREIVPVGGDDGALFTQDRYSDDDSSDSPDDLPPDSQPPKKKRKRTNNNKKKRKKTSNNTTAASAV